MSRTKYTKEVLEPIVQQAQSIAQVLKALNLKPTGGNYSHIGKMIDRHDIDRSHFVGQGHMKGKTPNNRRPTSEYLSNKYFIKSHTLRKRLLDEGYFEHVCGLCQNTQWLDQPIALELHHIDCNPENNNLKNLQILCPNCHKYVHDQA